MQLFFFIWRWMFFAKIILFSMQIHLFKHKQTQQTKEIEFKTTSVTCKYKSALFVLYLIC